MLPAVQGFCQMEKPRGGGGGWGKIEMAGGSNGLGWGGGGGELHTRNVQAPDASDFH